MLYIFIFLHNIYKIYIIIIFITIFYIFLKFSNTQQNEKLFQNKHFINENKAKSRYRIIQEDIKSLYENNTEFNKLIADLNNYSNKTKKTNIIFSDYYISNSCLDKNAFLLFEYYLKNNIDFPYYIVNNESDFYFSLLKKNKTKNLILYNDRDIKSFYNNLYIYLKDTKIIVTSYSIRLLQFISSYVPYIKYLKINHGIKYFKLYYAKIDIIEQLRNKTNIICSSPLEYELLVKKLKYKDEQIYNASLVRYERFQFIHKNKSENNCILISFTYRKYDKLVFEKSLYKKNLENLLNDKELIHHLSNKKIDLIYIPHHHEVDLGKQYEQNNFDYAEIRNQSSLENCIEQCSLFITDFSSICFDFMFQNKPVLFYSIDKNDTNSYFENKYLNDSNNRIYFGNYFEDKNLLINKIKYYTNNNFNIGNKLY